MKLNDCADLFLKLTPNLVDREVATEAMNKDAECRQALLYRAGIEELRKSGAI